MNYEVFDCIDAGSEFCPCHLAETGDCILCSQLAGKKFCDCINWKGVCIYQEFIWNGGKAAKERRTYTFNVIKKELLNENVVLLTVKTSHKLASELTHPGSYVFMRKPGFMQYYDVPLSIMDCSTEENWIKVVVEIKGVKTTSLCTVKENDNVLVRGPYWNGIHGLKNIYNYKNGRVLVIMRGIGQAPALPVLKKLASKRNNNSIFIIMDEKLIEKNIIKEWTDKNKAEIYNCNILEKGCLTEDFLSLFKKLSTDENINLIHCAGPDVLSYRILENIDLMDLKIPFSCCNNSKMCCGEGICGSCTIKTNDHRLRRLCKLQTEPRYVLKGRRKL